ncbi:MAG: threonine synthase [Clostridiaceae bacterium]|nr:threonine synthase [Clostridiaceae bacterium]
MIYISTRGNSEPLSAAMAIKQGIAIDGGLLVPEFIPEITPEQINAMAAQTYQERAIAILSLFLTDYTRDELTEAVTAAYGEERFQPEPAPLIQLNKYNDREFMLELWHGPTAAFKDLALQLLPHLMTIAIRKTDETADICILTATSGDTGKAALEGFRDIPGTRVIVFYPSRGVSEAQRLQMITQEGGNCHVVAVDGTFDDAQSGVKMLFSDPDLAGLLREKNILLSSANSINWGRLVPQIVYYFSAYADLLQRQKIEPGEAVNVVVPTGNFGNILAAWYARRMGLPIHKLICASNRNKVLSDFIRNGHYDQRREFYKTNSPSMDILVSSNLERLLFELTGRSEGKVSQWMSELQSTGHYQIDNLTLHNLQEVFVGGFADDIGTVKTIREVYDRCDHMIDTHTAVGFNVYSRYAARSGDDTKTIFVSTASPFKFSGAVGDALFGSGYGRGRSEEKLLQELSAESGMEIPATLANLGQRPVRHKRLINKEAMRDTVIELLTAETPAAAEPAAIAPAEPAAPDAAAEAEPDA